MKTRTIQTSTVLALAIAVLCAVASGGQEQGGLVSFVDDCRKHLASAAENNRIVVAGSDGWLFFSGDLRLLTSGEFWSSAPADKSPLDAVLDFKKRLDKLGIELLLVPVPPKAVVYSDKLSPQAPLDGKGPRRTDGELQKFYKLLRSEGVSILDLTDDFIAARRQDDALGPVYCRQDSHWSGRACELTAKKLVAEMAKRPWFHELKRQEFEITTTSVQIEGDLWKALPEPQPARETIGLRKVFAKPGRKPVQPDSRSPVILLGDSHNLVFSIGEDLLAANAGLLEQIAAESGVVTDLVAVRGSGATPSRINLYRRGNEDPTYLSRKKLIIWCFSAREFAEPGWRKIPVNSPRG
jgi:alginate O-acetyltransferase complex protein AlgJ